jgi:5-methylcytosine-specific restriction endonuclease McrA
MDKKVCARCFEKKPVSQFSSHRGELDGLQPECKVCNSERYKLRGDKISAKMRAERLNWTPEQFQVERDRWNSWKAANRERHREYQRRHYEANKHLYQASRERNRANRALQESERRARKAASGGTITLEAWKIRCHAFHYQCYLCGEQLDERTVTMDHVMPLSRGGSHTIENVAPACGFCNCSKHNLTVTEFVARG